MKDFFSRLFKKEGTRSVIASLISIVIGLFVGSLLILIVGSTSKNLSLTTAWEGIRIVLMGIFSTGRDAAGALTDRKSVV